MDTTNKFAIEVRNPDINITAIVKRPRHVVSGQREKLDWRRKYSTHFIKNNINVSCNLAVLF